MPLVIQRHSPRVSDLSKVTQVITAESGCEASSDWPLLFPCHQRPPLSPTCRALFKSQVALRTIFKIKSDKGHLTSASYQLLSDLAPSSSSNPPVWKEREFRSHTRYPIALGARGPRPELSLPLHCSPILNQALPFSGLSLYEVGGLGRQVLKSPSMYDSAPRKRGVVPHFGSRPGAARGFSLSQIPQTREGWLSPLSGSPGLQQASLDLQLITSRPTLVK